MSGDAPEQKPSQAEVTQARNAANRWNERVNEGYLELEKQALADSQVDHSQYIGGRASADLAAQEQQGLRALVGAGGQANDLLSLGNTVAEAETTQDVDTASQATQLRDARMVEMGKVGQDVAANAESGLRSAAHLGASRANNKLNNKILTDNAKFAAVMSAASGAANGAAMRADGFRLTKSGMQKTHEGWSNGSKIQFADDAARQAHFDKPGNSLGWTDMLKGGI